MKEAIRVFLIDTTLVNKEVMVNEFDIELLNPVEMVDTVLNHPEYIVLKQLKDYPEGVKLQSRGVEKINELLRSSWEWSRILKVKVLEAIERTNKEEM
jgi:hypothetical protein